MGSIGRGSEGQENEKVLEDFPYTEKEVWDVFLKYIAVASKVSPMAALNIVRNDVTFDSKVLDIFTIIGLSNFIEKFGILEGLNGGSLDLFNN